MNSIFVVPFCPERLLPIALFVENPKECYHHHYYISID